MCACVSMCSNIQTWSWNMHMHWNFPSISAPKYGMLWVSSLLKLLIAINRWYYWCTTCLTRRFNNTKLSGFIIWYASGSGPTSISKNLQISLNTSKIPQNFSINIIKNHHKIKFSILLHVNCNNIVWFNLVLTHKSEKIYLEGIPDSLEKIKGS